ncbi:MAG: endonuclease/exonuclease/phosphatase family protein [Candidatus Taylorbacteria bacterium]|nr:endonuclease/exonuclease/phosphatase family protein [Candidatus Taylorbacteria bacterium]
MKIVTLNAWGGRMKDRFSGFFNRYRDVDLWLFQEVYNSKKEEEFVAIGGYEKPDFSLNQTLSALLTPYKDYFCPTFRDIYGLSAFMRPDIKVISFGEALVARGDWHGGDYDGKGDHNRKLQWLEIEMKGKSLLVLNAHLTHRPEGKGDSSKRLLQSEAIVRFMSLFDCPKILMGDFNLLPDTESIRVIERAGMRNLIKEYGIASTRTEVYKKPHRFADYVFVSEDIEVKDFKVLPDVVSDHSPVYLDFEIGQRKAA